MSEVCIRNSTYKAPEIGKLLAPLGGISEVVQKGDRVLLKVNLLSARSPEKAVTTHPELVRAVAREVKKAGGKPFIGDSPAGRFNERGLRKAYKATGLADISKEEDIPLNWDTGSTKREISEGKRLKRVPVCHFVLNADKIIALPKLKTHSLQYMTLACKIMYGAVPGLTKAKYHAQFPRRAAFADMMLDILTVVKPDLYILDGILGMQGQGPGNGDPIQLGWLLASTDPVAMDMAVCRLIGIEPVAIPVLKKARVRKLWPDHIHYPLLKPEEIPRPDYKMANTAGHLVTGKKPPSKKPKVSEKCTACGECKVICPKEAISIENKRATVDDSTCIRCFCCHEVCPEDAIQLVSVR
ncbi:MAG: DUF362 domain-containing protein [Deltaproteobacteria bacterium]|nr:DUF362 domain-containing protein [Deltaproteobacteria bacterium]